ncbi:MAG: HAD family phosphatase [Firmicutes bacterium]|nr:HAD family phosphatase [Bacillota bacterium]
MLTKEQIEKIRIIATDLDNTLLNGQSMLSEATVETLKRAMAKGYMFIPATGRALKAVPSFIREFEGIDYMVTSNGARLVKMPGETTVSESLMTAEDIERVMPWISGVDYMIEIFTEGRVFIDQRCMDDLEGFGLKSERSRQYRRETRTPVPDCLEILKKAPDRVENINLIIPEDEKRLRIAEELRKLPGLNIVSSAAYNIEIGSEKTSKGNALAEAAALCGLSPENIIAFGDSTNDRHMIESCGIGVAMGNAGEEVKKAADLTAPANTEDGVAFILRTVLGI